MIDIDPQYPPSRSLRSAVDHLSESCSIARRNVEHPMTKTTPPVVPSERHSMMLCSESGRR